MKYSVAIAIRKSNYTSIRAELPREGIELPEPKILTYEEYENRTAWNFETYYNVDFGYDIHSTGTTIFLRKGWYRKKEALGDTSTLLIVLFEFDSAELEAERKPICYDNYTHSLSKPYNALDSKINTTEYMEPLLSFNPKDVRAHNIAPIGGTLSLDVLKEHYRSEVKCLYIGPTDITPLNVAEWFDPSKIEYISLQCPNTRVLEATCKHISGQMDSCCFNSLRKLQGSITEVNVFFKHFKVEFLDILDVRG